MGRGDRRSKKGKIWRGSFGNVRPKTKKGYTAPPKTEAAKVEEAPAVEAQVEAPAVEAQVEAPAVEAQTETPPAAE